jgi:type I restriction enzyme S subunit
MSEWQEVRLRECISTLKGFAFKSKWYQPDGVPIVRVSDFTDNSISVDNIEHISHDLAQEQSRYLLKTKDVIIQTVGSWQHNPASIVGKVVNVPSNLNDALLNQNAVKLIPNKTIDNNFLYK